MSETKYILLVANSTSIFNAGSPQAEQIKDLTNGFIIAASAMLLLVIILTIYIPIKYKGKKGDAEPKQISGSRKLEMLMVGVPLLMVIFFFFWSLRTMSAVLPDHGEKTPDVIVTGHQWWWEVHYPGTNVITANEIHLPAEKKILLQLNSADVIHDWWVPSLSGKMDMMPGRTNYLWMTINKPGIYDGACSEFCGQQHAWMRIRVIAQSPADYAQWLQMHNTNAVMPTDTLAQKGKMIFENMSCSSCHTVRGTIAKGTEGPDLTHFASRGMMLAGMKINDSVNVSKWIDNPQKVKPGANMPKFILGQDSIKAITSYLRQLQ